MSSTRGLHRTILAYRESLRFLPDGPYQRYCAWLLDQPAYCPRWLRLSGLEELVRMTGALLDGLPLDEAEVNLLTSHSTVMSVHQIYEVVSDNLAIGLGGEARAACEAAGTGAQQELLRSFNAAVIESLRAMDAAPARARAGQWATAARGLSAFRYSNDEAEHRALVAAYLRTRPGEDPRALEFSVAPSLLANVESGLALAGAARELATWDLFIGGLIRRYSAVQRLITQPPADQEVLIATGTDSIMVIPTLAYYTGLINEVVHPVRGYSRVLADGSLQRLLTDAALLVRLVNDLGTRLLEQEPADRARLLARLSARARTSPGMDLSALLWQAQAAEGALLTRLKKDIGFGEFNVGLDGIRQLPAEQALEQFQARLDDITGLYHRTLESLTAGAAELPGPAGDRASRRPGPGLRRLSSAALPQNFRRPDGGLRGRLSRTTRGGT